MERSKERKHWLILALGIGLSLSGIATARDKTASGSAQGPSTTSSNPDLNSASLPTSDDHALAAYFLSINTKPDHFSQGALHVDFENFRSALKFFYQKNPTQAQIFLQKIHPDFVLKKYVQYFSAKTLMEMGKIAEALKLLPASTTAISQIDADLQWLRWEALALHKDLATLTSELKKAEKRLRADTWELAHMHEILALAQMKAGNKIAASPHMSAVLVENPGTPSDPRLINLMAQFSVRADTFLSSQLWMQRAENLIAIGNPVQALHIYEELYAKSSGEHKKQLSEKIAYATFKSRDYRRAASLYDTLLKNGQYSSPKTEILEKIAQSYARHDDFAHAIATNKSIMAEYPGSAAASIADFKLGFLLYDSGQFKEAVRYFDKYIDKGTPRQKQQARWFRLWSYYWQKDYVRANTELGALITATKDNKEKRGLQYWQARIEQKQGHTATARTQFTTLIQNEGDDYYGMLSRQRLRSTTLQSGTLADPTWLSVPDGSSRPLLEPRSSGVDGPLLGAILLHQIGLDEYAYDEASRSGSVATAEGLASLQAGGNFVAGYVATRAGKMSLPGTDALNSYRFGWPRAYAGYISVYTRSFHVPASLPYAIMRQESTFRPSIRSAAFASGLMQIIPPTAAQIATDLGFAGFDIGMLSIPRINTLFGTYYLGQLLREFNGNLVYAIAAYNAGPDAVSRWAQKATTWEADEFIESIPYTETRDYVKKVLCNLWMYEKIY